MQLESSTGTWSLQEYRLVLAHSLVADNTLRRYLKGGRLQRATLERITNAVRSLGLQPSAEAK